MPNHDHTKLEPIVKSAVVAYKAKNFELFTSELSKCIQEMREHIHWENKQGAIKELKDEHPELNSEIKELNVDHQFLIASLEEARSLAKHNDPQAFEIFEQFLKLRKKHVNHEDELYIDTHTIDLKS
jgi:uncharacterized coiled-coil DUF342 family protein